MEEYRAIDSDSSYKAGPRRFTGLNVQYPISELILSGKKTIETRTYPIPKKYLNRDLLLIETPGKSGKFKSRAVAIIRFSRCFQYQSSKDFYLDRSRHFVSPESPWAWLDKNPKWGWEIDGLRLIAPKTVTKRLGIKFTLDLTI